MLRNGGNLRRGPRERAFEEGAALLADAELLALVLGTGVAGRSASVVAADLLESAGGLPLLARLGPVALASHPGVGASKAARIAASFELGRRGAARAAIEGADATPLVTALLVALRMSDLRPLLHEEMWILCLDGKARIRARRRIAQGGLHSCAVAARDVMRVVLCEGASAFVLVHNHPGDDPMPSKEDIRFTLSVARAGDIVGVPLVDHVIVTPSGAHRSLLELGVLAQTTP